MPDRILPISAANIVAYNNKMQEKKTRAKRLA
ncbi:hypothetical protein AGR1B_pa0277 [Agrobacterium fabacearum S56]|nr:hypothetical protein AGR1B_pa0277 [Agrobacterium fabacearum S56]